MLRFPRAFSIPFLLAISVVAELAPESAKGQAESYLGAALSNAAAIQSYDCLVTTEAVMIPNKEIEERDSGYYEELIERVIFSPSKEFSIHCQRRKYSAVDPAKQPERKITLPFEKTNCSVFMNGETIATNIGKRPTELAEFQRTHRVPRMDLASFNGHPYFITQDSTAEHIDAQISGSKYGKVTLQPDGMVGCVWDLEEREYADYLLFDPKTSMVKQFKRRQKRDGQYPAGTNSVERTYTYEEVDGIFRLVQMEFEEAATNVSPYRRVGTTQIQWLRFNDDAMEVASADEILSKRSEYASSLLSSQQ